jgi:hypothetical protein
MVGSKMMTRLRRRAITLRCGTRDSRQNFLLLWSVNRCPYSRSTISNVSLRSAKDYQELTGSGWVLLRRGIPCEGRMAEQLEIVGLAKLNLVFAVVAQLWRTNDESGTRIHLHRDP